MICITSCNSFCLAWETIKVLLLLLNVISTGMVGLVGACVWGAIAYKNRGPMSTSRYLMRLRVIAQSCVVGSIMVGLGVTALQDSRKKDN